VARSAAAASSAATSSSSAPAACSVVWYRAIPSAISTASASTSFRTASFATLVRFTWSDRCGAYTRHEVNCKPNATRVRRARPA
jgi:hypothetical protein